MTEEEWLQASQRYSMLGSVRVSASDRKLRLLACACVQRIEHLIPPRLRHDAIAIPLQHADGIASDAEMNRVGTDAYYIGIEGEGDRDEATAPYRAEEMSQCDLLRDLFGNPFRPVVADPAWLSPTVQSIAASIYQDRAFDRLPILADALEDAGCTNADVLLHCRQPGEHVRGCWVVDLVLGKE